MGDILSTKKNSTTNTVFNKQVTQQAAPGSAQVGISGTIGDNSDVTVISGDTEVALQAIQAMGQSTNMTALAAIESNKTGQLGLGVAARSLDVAEDSIHSSSYVVTQVLEYMQQAEAGRNEIIGQAVGSAQEIALRAAPVSPGSYGEIIQQGENDLTKNLLYVGAGIAALIVLVYAFKK